MNAVARLFVGHVWHARQTPVTHRFRYPHAWLALTLPAGDQARLPLAPGIVWQRRRHGPRDGSPLFPWLCARLAEHGVDGVDSAELHTLPAVAGYAFNPVSFYLARDAQRQLLGVWVEVNNTFGAHHDYWLPATSGDESLYGHADKALQVSPFYRVEGQYAFRFLLASPDRFTVRIDYSPDGGAPSFTAALQGSTRPSNAANWLRVATACLSLTFAVWLRIHWQAWRLWRKGVPFFGKNGHVARPPSPRSET